MGCAATTTIREAVVGARNLAIEMNGTQIGRERIRVSYEPVLAALTSLEQLVEAAQALERGGRTPEFDAALAPLRAALAAVGPGEETAG